MTFLVAIFVFGCFVTAFVAVGLVLAMSALDVDGPGAFEGRTAEEQAVVEALRLPRPQRPPDPGD